MHSIRWPLTLAAVLLYGGSAMSQEKDVLAATRAQPPVAKPGREPRFRRIAPGIERTIDPEMQKEERFSRHDLKDLLKEDPQFGERPSSNNLAKDVRFSHDVWGLVLTFKPVRFIDVDVPHEDGRFERKKIWYLPYRVTNRGETPVRFVPRFLLHSWDMNKWYPDRLAPLAVPLIQKREDPARTWHNTVEISDLEVPPAKEGADNSLWGVATWEDIDPRTDHFTIYIQGLTNAYKWIDQEDGKTRFFRKTLVLNFWRPGDELDEQESEIRYGVPEGSMTAGQMEQARKTAGWSQAELAKKIGVEESKVAAWEKATEAIPADRVPLLREVLGPHLDPEVDYRWIYK